MAERYTILQHNTNTFYVVDCPLLLISHALTKDNQNNNIFIQCKFENTLSKSIKALYVHINCFDVTNNPLPTVDSFSYLDIEVKQYQTFGDKTPIVLPDKETRNVSIIPTKIVFVDGSTWENDSDKPFELFHIDNTPISELGELAEEYKRELHGICLQSDKHKYLPANKDGYTICGCGKILVDAEKTCPACGVDLEKLFALHDVDKLQAGLEQYQKEQAEREEQARQAEEERQKQIEAQKQKAIKIGKKTGIIGGSIVALIAVCALVVQVIIPNVRYSMANNAVSAGNYEEAISTFEDLADFKDSQEKIKETQYAWAESKLASGDAEGAIELFETLGDYEDSADRIQKIQDSASYEQAEKEFENGNYEEAKTLFENLGNYSDAASRAQECANIIGEEHYSKAMDALNKSDNDTALKEFLLAVPYKDSIAQSREISDFEKKIVPGSSYTILMKDDGAIEIAGEDGNISDVKNWRNVSEISATKQSNNQFRDNVVGLQENGEVLSAGMGYMMIASFAEGWSDLIDIELGTSGLIGPPHLVGLHSDGTVVANGWSGWSTAGSTSINYNDGGGDECKVSGWSQITDIAAGDSLTVGLKSDGTVLVANGYDGDEYNTTGWNAISNISVGSRHIVGLKSDGTVVATGRNSSGQCDVSDWTDIVSIAAGGDFTLGLRSDGTVVAAGDNEDGQCNVSNWDNIIAIWTGYNYSIGLKSDGTFVAVGNNESGKCNVSNWDLW